MDNSGLINFIPTIWTNIGSRVFVSCLVIFYFISSFGKSFDSAWDWKLTRAVAKYELQNLNRGLYEITNISSWKKITPQLTRLFDSVHQIKKMQVLVSRITNGVIYKGQENLSGKRFIIRVDTSSADSIYAVEHLNTYKNHIKLNQDLVLELLPNNPYVIYSRTKKRRDYVKLLIIDTFD